MKNLKKIFKEFINERTEYTGVIALDKIYLSICYQLCKNNLAGEILDTYDLSILYDNLCINNELLTIENYTEYDLFDICQKYHKNELKIVMDITENNKIFLLNFDKILHNKKGYSYSNVIDCFIKFDTTFTYFNNNFEFI